MTPLEGGRRPRLLLVDDTPANLRILSDALRGDYELQVATSGKAALDMALCDDPPDMVLLDIMMPEMDGYEVCERLKADERTRDVPVVFVTAMGEVDDETRGLALGAEDYITKPINLDIVRARVRTHLSLSIARRRLAAQNLELQEAARLREEVERITRHDLKNPLTMVLSVPQLLLMADNLEDHQREMLGRVEEAGLAMLGMINFSLDLFKMEQGTYAPDPAPVDFAALARRVFRDLGDMADAAGVRFALAVDGRESAGGEGFMAMGEELLCYSMLGNLVRNAVEASSAGDVVAVELSSGDPVRIAVSNPAPVPRDMRGRFFDKYATSGKRQGTGLGTYSARLSARTLGGDVAMRTDDASGTVVTVSLPRA